MRIRIDPDDTTVAITAFLAERFPGFTPTNIRGIRIRDVDVPAFEADLEPAKPNATPRRPAETGGTDATP